jgi:hypothetical protein
MYPGWKVRGMFGIVCVPYVDDIFFGGQSESKATHCINTLELATHFFFFNKTLKKKILGDEWMVGVMGNRSLDKMKKKGTNHGSYKATCEKIYRRQTSTQAARDQSGDETSAATGRG